MSDTRKVYEAPALRAESLEALRAEIARLRKAGAHESADVLVRKAILLEQMGAKG